MEQYTRIQHRETPGAEVAGPVWWGRRAALRSGILLVWSVLLAPLGLSAQDAPKLPAVPLVEGPLAWRQAPSLRDGASPVDSLYAQVWEQSVVTALARDKRLAFQPWSEEGLGGDSDKDEAGTDPADPSAPPRISAPDTWPWFRALADQDVAVVAYARFTEPDDGVSTIQAWVADTRTGQVWATAWASMTLDVSFAVQARRLAETLAEQVEALPDRTVLWDPKRSTRVFHPTLTLTGLEPGMVVRLANGEALGPADDDGRLVLDALILEPRTFVTLEFEQEGFYPAARTYTPRARTTEIAAPALRPTSQERWGLVWNMNNLTNAGVDYWRFLRDDWQWIGGRAQIYVRPLVQESADLIPPLAIYPDVGVMAGTYVLTPPDWWVRLYAHSLFGIMGGIKLVPGASPTLDLYWQPWTLGTEVNLPRWTLGMEYTYRFYLGPLPTALFDRGYAVGSPRINVYAQLKKGRP